MKKKLLTYRSTIEVQYCKTDKPRPLRIINSLRCVHFSKEVKSLIDSTLKFSTLVKLETELILPIFNFLTDLKTLINSSGTSE